MYSFKLVDTLIDYPPFRSNMSQARDDNKPDDERQIIPLEEYKDLVEIFLKEVPQYPLGRVQEVNIDYLWMEVERTTTERASLSMDEMMEHSGDVEDAVEYADWETEDYEMTDQGNWMSSNYVSRADYDQLFNKLKQAENYLKHSMHLVKKTLEGEEE